MSWERVRYTSSPNCTYSIFEILWHQKKESQTEKQTDRQTEERKKERNKETNKQRKSDIETDRQKERKNEKNKEKNNIVPIPFFKSAFFRRCLEMFKH